MPRMTLTNARLRELAEVLGTCQCGKPAQVGFQRPDGSFGHECFDCSDNLRNGETTMETTTATTTAAPKTAPRKTGKKSEKVALKTICAQLKIDPKAARRKLRKAELSFHGAKERWIFTEAQAAKVREILKESDIERTTTKQ